MQSSHTHLKTQQRHLRALYKEKLRAAVWACALKHADFLKEAATRAVAPEPVFLQQPMAYASCAGRHGERLTFYAQARPATVTYKHRRTLQQ